MGRSRGSVFWDQGAYVVQISRGTDPRTGKRQRLVERVEPCSNHQRAVRDCRSCEDKAERLRVKILNELDEHRRLDSTKLTLGQFLDRWIETHKSQVRRRTYSGYKGKIEKQIKPYLGQLALQAVDVPTLNTFYAALLAPGARTKIDGYARWTVKACHTILRRSLGDAVAWKLLTHNPATEARLPADTDSLEAEDISGPALRVWTVEQVNRFLAAVQERRDYAFWFLAVYTGMRRSELLGLRWDKVDLDGGWLHVHRTLHWDEGDFIWAPPKSKKSRRDVRLSSGQVEVLREHRKRQLEERMVAGEGWQDNDLVFCAEDGTPDRPTNWSIRFTRLSDGLGLPRIGLHGLRHTCATLLIAAGVPIEQVSKRLGHANTWFTNDTYGHLTKEMGDTAAEAIDKALEG